MAKTMICGTRSREDVALLVEAGADAIGFITEVRQDISCSLSRETARRLIGLVPDAVCPVLIITEEDEDEISRMVDHTGPAVVQLHGSSTPREVARLKERLPVEIIKTLLVPGGRITDAEGLRRLAREYLGAGADYLLLDSSTAGKVGSTGLTLNFGEARRFRDALAPARLILAGGLNAGNAARAVGRVRPYAVDVYTGVVADGRLDPARVREFIRVVRRCGAEEA